LYYYHFDGLGSVAALSDVNSVIVERYSYDVFGEPNTTSSIGNPYMFTGRRFDSETSIYYYRTRYYKPDIGRFLQTDPIGYAGGLNLYTYVGNNSVSYVDPWGLDREQSDSDRRHRYNKIQEMLEFERRWGTLLTAWKYSNTWGRERMGELFDDYPLLTAYGIVDIDWFTDVSCFNPLRVNRANRTIYLAGKGVVQNLMRLYANLVYGANYHMMVPFVSDPKEGHTMTLMKRGIDTYRDLFPVEFMRVTCPAGCEPNVPLPGGSFDFAFFESIGP